MKKIKKESLILLKKEMRSIENYFERNIPNDNSFKSNYLTCKAINQLVQKDSISIKDLKKIVRLYNETNESEHHGGTGWHDLRLHIEYLLTINDLSFKKLENHSLLIQN